MRFGVCLPTFRYGAEPTQEHIRCVALKAEDLGYDSLWAGDHVLVPSDKKRMAFFTDPLVTLSYLAGVTDRVLLGTSVVVAPLRNPLVLAKQGATIFQTICQVCHGLDGKGKQEMGSANLTDNTWLHGGSEESIRETIRGGRNNQMPAHKDRLGEEKVHMLALYVYSLSRSE